MLFLRTTERSGTSFIRTDQLDGETDWKLRLAVQSTQRLHSDSDLFEISAQVYAEKPQKDIHSFVGTFTRVRWLMSVILSLESLAPKHWYPTSFDSVPDPCINPCYSCHFIFGDAHCYIILAILPLKTNCVLCIIPVDMQAILDGGSHWFVDNSCIYACHPF